MCSIADNFRHNSITSKSQRTQWNRQRCHGQRDVAIALLVALRFGRTPAGGLLVFDDLNDWQLNSTRRCIINMALIGSLMRIFTSGGRTGFSGAMYCTIFVDS